MSWMAHCLIPKGYNIHDDEPPVLKEMQIGGNDQAPKERDEQVAAAKDAVRVLLLGAVSENTGRGTRFAYRVSISGHANVGHQPSGQWTNDMVTVSVAQTQDEK